MRDDQKFNEANSSDGMLCVAKDRWVRARIAASVFVWDNTQQTKKSDTKRAPNTIRS